MGRDGWVTLGIVELKKEMVVNKRMGSTYFEGVLAFALLVEEVTKVHIYLII
jgi:hypothetical protein